MGILFQKGQEGVVTSSAKSRILGSKKADNWGGTPVINYNQPLPNKDVDGNPYFITRSTVETQGNPAFKSFDDGWDITTDPTQYTKYGNIQPSRLDKDTGKWSYYTNSYGDSTKMQQAHEGKISLKDLGF